MTGQRVPTPGPAPDDPDAEAVAAAMAGDTQALSHLMEKLHLRVFRFILRQVSREEDAEDLTQETFLQTHRNLARFRGASRFSTWVMGIAQNLVRNQRSRSPDIRFPPAPEHALETLEDQHGDPHAAAQFRARMERLHQAMVRHLSDDLREALILVSLEEMPYDQAAQVLDIPLGTLKTRVFRARRRLLEGLERSGELELFR